MRPKATLSISNNLVAFCELSKGHHRPLPEVPPTIPWLMFRAFEHFLPRRQAARR